MRHAECSTAHIEQAADQSRSTPRRAWAGLHPAFRAADEIDQGIWNAVSVASRVESICTTRVVLRASPTSYPACMTAPLLVIEDLHASAGDVEIIKGMDLKIERGEIHALMGPNGSGKSTLSYVLMGIPATQSPAAISTTKVRTSPSGPPTNAAARACSSASSIPRRSPASRSSTS